VVQDGVSHYQFCILSVLASCMECRYLLGSRGRKQPVGTRVGHLEPLDCQIHPRNACYRKVEWSYFHPPPIHRMHGGLYPIHLRRFSRFPNIGGRTGGFLRRHPLERSNTASQLANTALIAPATGQHLPTTIVERNQVEHHQMRIPLAENPQAEPYKQVATMWIS